MALSAGTSFCEIYKNFFARIVTGFNLSLSKTLIAKYCLRMISRLLFRHLKVNEDCLLRRGIFVCITDILKLIISS